MPSQPSANPPQSHGLLQDLQLSALLGSLWLSTVQPFSCQCSKDCRVSVSQLITDQRDMAVPVCLPNLSLATLGNRMVSYHMVGSSSTLPSPKLKSAPKPRRVPKCVSPLKMVYPQRSWLVQPQIEVGRSLFQEASFRSHPSNPIPQLLKRHQTKATASSPTTETRPNSKPPYTCCSQQTHSHCLRYLLLDWLKSSVSTCYTSLCPRAYHTDIWQSHRQPFKSSYLSSPAKALLAILEQDLLE